MERNRPAACSPAAAGLYFGWHVRQGLAMTDAPPLDHMLQEVFAHVEGDDVLLFYAYFEELKGHVRKYLSARARLFPGESHVAQSPLFSLFCDLAVQQIPLEDVDEHGYPMLWPLLLKYIERHCEKWKKYYRAKKRDATEVPHADGVEPADYRAADDEFAVGEAL